MKATDSTGNLVSLEDCYIKIENKFIYMYVLPDISDSKNVTYADMTGIGRSMPIKVFSHGEVRQIGWQVHFFGETVERIYQNLEDLRLLESLTYPDSSSTTPVIPPKVAKIKCGKMLADNELCAILRSYSVKFPTDVVWFAVDNGKGGGYIPTKFDVDLQFEVVYSTSTLPGAEKIISVGG